MLLYRIESVDYLKDETHFRQGYEHVPSYRRTKIDRMRLDEDKRRSLGAELLLEKMLREAGFPEMAEKRSVSYSDRGKPYFPGNPVYFSLSHSGNRVMCAVSDKPVGCDIEQIDTKKTDCTALARRFYNERESWKLEETVRKQPNGDDAAVMFFTLWTQKEAYAKCTDTPLENAMKTDLSGMFENNNHDEGLEYEKHGIDDGYAWAVITGIFPDKSER